MRHSLGSLSETTQTRACRICERFRLAVTVAFNSPLTQNRKRTPSVGNLGIDWSRTSTMRGWSDVGST